MHDHPHLDDSTAAALPNEFFALGPVELRVTDIDRASQFWQRLIGLSQTGPQPGSVSLGSNGRTLIVLRQSALRPAVGGYSGLYHVAVHFASESEFAHVLVRLMTARWPITAVDHLMSKAVYLQDPDGITIELDFETPWRMREARVDALRGLHAIDQEGNIHRPSEPLDVPALLVGIDESKLTPPVDGAYIGHVHLSVADLGAAVEFYRDRLGMLVHMYEPSVNFADLHGGGDFQHRIAVNTFQSAGAALAPANTAGMDRYTIRFQTADGLSAVKSRLEDAGIDSAPLDSGAVAVHDPAGNALRLIA
jgi:catechol 2,3-dioxygenase